MDGGWNGTAWIWSGDSDANRHVCLRRTFECGRPGAGELLVCADTDFVAYINGIELGRGQFPDYPADKTFTRLAVDVLRAGANTVAILAYHAGHDFHTGVADVARVAARLWTPEGVVATDASWKAAAHAAYAAGVLPPRTTQLGFTAAYDARLAPDDAWTRPGFDDSAWPAARVVGPVDAIRERPVPPPALWPPTPATAAWQGWVWRAPAEFDNPRFALACDRDVYVFDAPASVFVDGRDPVLRPDGGAGLVFRPADVPPRAAGAGGETMAAGYFLIADLGAETVGYLELALSAPAGTVVDISHGEHLDDGRVRMAIGDRNFTDRYICRDGNNRWTPPFRRYGARYLQLNIFPPADAAESVTVRYVGLWPWERWRPDPAAFDGDDREMLHLRRVAIRTLELCQHEHYEDCPWREQALYAYDSRNQALYNYYLWGNYDFTRESFALLGRGARPDRQLRLCAPTAGRLAIPAFTLVWMAAARDHGLFSGDGALYREFGAWMEDLLEEGLLRRRAPTEPRHTGNGDGWWHFYEWSDGMAHSGARIPDDEFHAPHQLYLAEAALAFADMADMAGQPERARRPRAAAREVQAAFDRHFWDEARGAYATILRDGRLADAHHDHVQLLALATGAVPEARRERVWQTLRAETLTRAELSVLPYLPRALMEHSPSARRFVREKIERHFYPMLRRGATSLWETEEGGDAFGRAGSLCHAWSSLPVYYLHACVLGVAPLAPAFRRFRVKPWADGRFNYAEGEVPTPSGPVRVKWRRESAGLRLRVDAPAGLEAVIESYPEQPVFPW